MHVKGRLHGYVEGYIEGEVDAIVRGRVHAAVVSGSLAVKMQEQDPDAVQKARQACLTQKGDAEHEA
jgi:predicted methyltransferase MtxX (methanogen marker protein 4)